MAIHLSESDLEKIGLQALCDTDQFSSGMEVYVEGLREMEAATDKTAAAAAKATEDGAKEQQKALQDTAAAAEDAAARQKRAQEKQQREAEAASKKQAAALKEVALAFGAVGAAGEALLMSMAMTAARTEELNVILDVTVDNARRMAEADGNWQKASELSSQAVKGEVQAVKDLGITTQVATQLVAQLVRYNMDWSQASDLARLAQDAATYAAQDTSTALAGILHGIETYNVRVLRTYGIVTDLQAAFERWATAQGRTAESLSVTEKQQIALNEVLAQGPAIAGAYEAAMSTASKQARSLGRSTNELAEEFGQGLTPCVTASIGALRGLMSWLSDLPDPIQATVAQVGAIGSGFLAIGSSAALIVPKISKLIASLRALQAVQALSSAGMLGPAGLVAGLVAVGGAAILYANNVKEAHIEEAAATAETAQTYQGYIQALDDSGRSAYALSQGLYELVKAQNAARQAEYAKQLLKTAEDLKKLSLAVGGQTGNAEVIGAIYNFRKEGEVANAMFTDMELIVLSDRDAVLEIGTAYGKSGQELIAWTDKVVANAIATRTAAEAEKNYNAFEKDRAKILTSMAPATEDAAKATSKYSDEMWEAAAASAAADKAINDRIGLLVAVATYEEQAADPVKRAAEEMVDAEEQADEERADARAEMLADQEAEEREHAAKVATLERKLADDIRDAQADLQHDEVDARRDFDRDQEDAARDHARKLEDIDRDYWQDLLDLQAKYNQDAADLEREHSQSEKDIREKFKEARIQELVRLGGDEQKIRENWTDDMIQGPLREQMDAELAGLDEAYNEKLGTLAKELEREKAAKDEAWKEERARQEERFREEQADRQREFDRKIEDLRRNAAEEVEKLKAAAKEQLEAERQSHLDREEEIRKAYASRLGEIDTKLAKEQQAIRDGLGAELLAIVEELGKQSKAFQDSYTLQLLDQDVYLKARIEREKAYQKELEDLYGVHSPSAYMIDFAKSLRQGLNVGWAAPTGMQAGPATAPALGAAIMPPALPDLSGLLRPRAATSSTSVSVPIHVGAINNGMDQAYLQSLILTTVQRAMRGW